MDQSAFRTLLQRYQQGECTSAEIQRIENWYRHLGEEQQEQQLKLTPEDKVALMATMWQRISPQTVMASASLDTAPKSARLVKWTSWSASVRLAAAAAFVGVVSLAGLKIARLPVPWGGSRAAQTVSAAKAANEGLWLVFTNSSAHDIQVALPDGSAVTLAPASILKYQRRRLDNRRVAYLTGAAFFKVYHDRKHPFSVLTDKVMTTVLGTSFRVQAHTGQSEVQVQVRTGAVRVSQREGTGTAAPVSIDVLPNQQAVYSAARQQLRRELVAEPVLLVPQPFVFKDRPVAEVLAALEKAYGITISYDAAALRNCTLNLSLTKGSLFDKLDIICEASGASYEKVDGHILFHSRSC